MKQHVPINLKQFVVQNNTATNNEVTRELRELIEWLKTNQNNYYQNHYDELVNKILSENIQLKGSLNSLGRKLDIKPPTPATYQPYNLAEMFRVSILSKTSLFIQNELITNILQSLEKPTTLNVLESYKKYYPTHKPPTYQFIKRAIDRLTTTGVMHSIPKGDGVLNF